MLRFIQILASHPFHGGESFLFLYPAFVFETDYCACMSLFLFCVRLLGSICILVKKDFTPFIEVNLSISLSLYSYICAHLFVVV